MRKYTDDPIFLDMAIVHDHMIYSEVVRRAALCFASLNTLLFSSSRWPSPLFALFACRLSRPITNAICRYGEITFAIPLCVARCALV